MRRDRSGFTTCRPVDEIGVPSSLASGTTKPSTNFTVPVVPWMPVPLTVALRVIGKEKGAGFVGVLIMVSPHLGQGFAEVGAEGAARQRQLAEAGRAGQRVTATEAKAAKADSAGDKKAAAGNRVTHAALSLTGAGWGTT